MIITVGARESSLSKAQFDEVLSEISSFSSGNTISANLVKTTGDKDLTTSLRTLGQTDFFTKRSTKCSSKDSFESAFIQQKIFRCLWHKDYKELHLQRV